MLGSSTLGLFIRPQNFYIFVDYTPTSLKPNAQEDPEEAFKLKQQIAGSVYPKQLQYLIVDAVSNVAINYSFHPPLTSEIRLMSSASHGFHS